MKNVVKRQKKCSANNNTLFKRIYRYRWIYAMILPALLGYLVFHYGPMYGIQLAFKDYWFRKGITASPWVGFKHFEAIFKLNKFYKVMGNTLIINFSKILFTFPAPIILALLLNEIANQKFKRTVQTIIYLPHFISWVIISGIITAFLGFDGMFNQILVQFGAEKVNIITNKDMFRPLVIMSSIWKETGWGTIIYLAAIAGINPEIYESAIVDGANRWHKLIYITLPSILPTVSVLLILRFGSVMTTGFDQIFNLYNEAVYQTGDIITTYTYRIGLGEGRYEMATAIGLFLNVINLGLLMFVNKSSKKISGNGLY